AVCLFFIGFQPVVWLISAALLCYNVCLPIAFGSEQVIWQHKVEPALQGRVFSAAGAISMLMLPIGSFASGILADRVFEPLMQPGGALANTVGTLIGTGPGRGIALIFMLLSVLLALIALWGWRCDAIRNVEDDLPDAIGNVIVKIQPNAQTG
ncbi:MAG: hypothetical protein MJK04_19235, partial [Psychrosphaera sp.]|nr:hypothetical protein [Psychrosphaera sp.]